MTPHRRPRVFANDEYTASARPILRGYARRVSAGDIEAVTWTAALADDIDQADSIPAILSVS